jgi:outer membrane receptor protein involved in Fe transport
MKKLLTALIATGLAGGAISLIASDNAAYADAFTTGSLRGVVKDKGTGEPTVGATVVATSAALQGEQVVITDESGGYYITSLPPGIYTLTVYYNDTTYSRNNVLVQVGKEAVVNLGVDISATKGETINISGTAPIVDQGSTKVGSTITSDFTNNVPTGRTFGDVIQNTASAQGDTYGISFAGATSAENTYVVEGLNTTDTGFGVLSSNLPNEFIQETEVITGGYNAEFGRATGAIVNVVTKTGSNQFHGSVFGHIQPSALTASSDRILREGTAIDREVNQNYKWDLGAELGGPIIKDKLWFHVGFTPTVQKTTTTRIVNRSIDSVDNKTGMPVPGGDGVVDIDPNTGFTQREQVASRDIPSDYKTYFFTAKLTGAISSNHQWQITGFGNPETDEAVFATVRDPNSARFRNETGAYDFSGKWTSKFNEGKTQLDAVVGFHNGFTAAKPLNAADDVVAVRYNYTRSLYDFRDLEGDGAIEGCHDSTTSLPYADDPYPKIQNCPVLRYTDRGLGFLEDRTNNRTSAVLSLTQRVKAAGQHVFKVGLDTEFSSYNSGRRFTGGAFILRDSANNLDNNMPPPLDDFEVDQYLKYDPNTTNPIACGRDTDGDGVGNGKCSIIEQLNADTNDRSIAAYIQDSWQIRPNLTLNAGLRWEQQVGYVAKFLQGTVAPDTGETIPNVGFQLDNLIAPRVGFIFDPTQEGRSKIFGHWGRFYENIPMDMNVRSFGGETQLVNFAGVDDSFNPNMDDPCNYDHNTPDLANQVLKCQRAAQTTLGGTISYVAPGMEGQYTQEFILGAEYEVIPDITVGANYIHRSLPTVIEDMSTDGGTNYFIGNPSHNYDTEADKLDAQAAMTTDLGLKSLYESRASQLRAVKFYDPPSRNYDAIELTAKKRPTGNSLLQASYTYSRAVGNYPGLFSTETGQLDPNITSQYDLPDLMPNRYGPSGLDRPHNLKVDGFYAFDFKKAGLLIVGGSFRAQSGTPHNTLAAHPIYGQGESYLLPRGALYRSPATSQLDTHFSYGRQLNKTTRLEGFIDVFNLFDSQTETDIDEIYSIQASLPIVGGDAEDLLHAKRTQARRQLPNVIAKSLNYGKLNNHQSPLTGQLGFRLTF